MILVTLMVLVFTVGVVAAPAVNTITANLASDFKFMLNGKAWTTQNTPLVVDGRTYLPLRAIGEALGVKIDWDPDTRTVIIGDAPVAEKPVVEKPVVEEPVVEEPVVDANTATAVVKSFLDNFSATNVTIDLNGTVAGIVKVGAKGTAKLDASGAASATINGDAGPLGQTTTNPAVFPFSEITFGPEAVATAYVASAELKDNTILIKGKLPQSFIDLLDNVNPAVTWKNVTADTVITFEGNKIQKIVISNGEAKGIDTPLGARDAVFTATLVFTY